MKIEILGKDSSGIFSFLVNSLEEMGIKAEVIWTHHAEGKEIIKSAIVIDGKVVAEKPEGILFEINETMEILNEIKRLNNADIKDNTSDQTEKYPNSIHTVKSEFKQSIVRQIIKIIKNSAQIRFMIVILSLTILLRIGYWHLVEKNKNFKNVAGLDAQKTQLGEKYKNILNKFNEKKQKFKSKISNTIQIANIKLEKFKNILINPEKTGRYTKTGIIDQKPEKYKNSTKKIRKKDNKTYKEINNIALIANKKFKEYEIVKTKAKIKYAEYTDLFEQRNRFNKAYNTEFEKTKNTQKEYEELYDEYKRTIDYYLTHKDTLYASNLKERIQKIEELRIKTKEKEKLYIVFLKTSKTLAEQFEELSPDVESSYKEYKNLVSKVKTKYEEYRNIIKNR